MAQTSPRRLPEWRRSRIPIRLGEDLAPGAVVPASTTNKVLVAILGSRVVRIRAKATGQACTLRARFVQLDHVTESTTAQPADVALASGVENLMNIVNVAGEAYVSVQIVNPAGVGVTVNFVDVSQLPST